MPTAHAIASVVFPPASRVLRLKRYICAPYPDRLDGAGGPARDKGPPHAQAEHLRDLHATATAHWPAIGRVAAFLPVPSACGATVQSSGASSSPTALEIELERIP